MQLRFVGGKQKALTLSYDDGVSQDIKLIDIMKKYGLKGTFNLNSGAYSDENNKRNWRMTKKDAQELYKNSGMEIASHGLTHPFLEQLPASAQRYEVIKDRINLENDFDTIVRGMAYPYGTYNEQVISTLKECGIVYSRTVASTEKFDIPEDWLRMPATCHHNNPRLMELAEKFLKGDQFGRPYLFYLWGHSYEFDTNDNWSVIENFAEYVGNRDDVWYATNIEIYDYVEAYRKLIFSLSGKKVYNPTCITLYFEQGKKVFCIEPGQTISL